MDAGAPSIAVYCNRAVMFEGIPRGILSVVSEKETPSGNPFPGGSKSKGKVKLSSEQTSLPRGRLRVAPIASKEGKPKMLRKATSLPRAKDKINGSCLLTRNGVSYRMTTVI